MIITTWTLWTWTWAWTRKLDDMDERLFEACTWNYLRKWYMVIIWAWQEHGGMVILSIWFTQRYSCSIIKLFAKTTRHGANIGKIDGGNWGSVH